MYSNSVIDSHVILHFISYMQVSSKPLAFFGMWFLNKSKFRFNPRGVERGEVTVKMVLHEQVAWWKQV